MIADQIENEIVTLIRLGEIFFRVVDHVIGADRPNKIDIASAADAGHLSAICFRNLHRKRADTARSAVDQNFLPFLKFSVAAQALQRRNRRNRHRARFFESDVPRLEHNRPVVTNADVFRKRAGFRAKHFVTWFERGYVFADRFNSASEVSTRSRESRFAQSGNNASASRMHSIQRIRPRRAHFDEDLIVCRSRLFDFFELQNFGRTVFTINNSFHRIIRSSRVAIAVIGGRPIGDEHPANEHDKDHKQAPFKDTFEFHRPNKSAGLGRQRFHICAANQKPEHDCHFGEESGLQPSKSGAVVSGKELRRNAERNPRKAGNDQPNAEESRQESGPKNEKPKRKQPQSPENLVDKLSLTMQTDEQHAKSFALYLVEYL